VVREPGLRRGDRRDPRGGRGGGGGDDRIERGGVREGIVICPICGGPLSEISRSFRCPRNHTFDRAREGYVHLLPTGHGRTKIRGQTAELGRARRRFLPRGYYDPQAAAVVGRVMSIQREGLTVVDVGCGEGHA